MQPSALIVDDDPAVARICCRVLVALGFAVMESPTIADGLTRARMHRVDLAICDILLPDGNGLDLILRMKKEALCSRFIVVTGTPSPEHEQRAASLGARFFIPKPFTIDDLRKAVTNIMEENS